MNNQKFIFLTLGSALDIIYFDDGMFSNGICWLISFDSFTFLTTDKIKAVIVTKRRQAKTIIAIFKGSAESDDGMF
jgi:hypothetical protein